MLGKFLSPTPQTNLFFVEVYGFRLGVLQVEAVSKPPVIAIKDLQAAAGEEQVLKQGIVYTRRRGQSAPISGEEFSQLLNSRDNLIREEIFSFLGHGRQIGFDKAIVARPTGNDAETTGMTFFLPAEAAKDLKVIDRARLVQANGAPAYEIQGSVRLTVPNNEDPREPLRATDSAQTLKADIEQIIWNGFPWGFSHLKRAADHLGFWLTEEGDQVHTGREPLTSTTIYYSQGRNAILNFARQNPSEFVDVVGSQETRTRWLRERALEFALVP